jgi:aminoglycoside phosphotransferase (APT) family kinase protein
MGEADGKAGLDLALGPKLASGRDADVFDLGNGQVLRRRRDGRNVEHEAAIMRYAHDHGYPVPAIHAASGPDQVMDRVDGPTMLADLGRRPWMVWRHARLLVGLHRRLHTIPGPDWLPRFPPGGAAAPIFSAESGTPREPAEADPSDALLHLDLHPDNVILSRRGPIVIDWANAKRGAGAADVALLWVIMATSEIPETGIKRLGFEVIRRLFVVGLLRHVDRRSVLQQLPAVARFRLADKNVRDSERPAIHALLRRNGLTV